jgi:hypothetical protein
MGELGVKAVLGFLNDGTKPKPSPGREFVNTGVELIADTPAPGVKSITAEEGRRALLVISWYSRPCSSRRPRRRTS